MPIGLDVIFCEACQKHHPPYETCATWRPVSQDGGANTIQVGGGHYNKYSIQPWDFYAALDLDFFQGSIIKYIIRFKDKGGLEDLQKAQHYLEKYIELQSAKGLK
jgi:hypothetical protein